MAPENRQSSTERTGEPDSHGRPGRDNATAVGWLNELPPLEENDVPLDLHGAYLVARSLATVPLILAEQIRNRARHEWLNNSERMSDMIGGKLRDFYAGNTRLTRAILVELGGLGHPVTGFGLHAPSRHEWVVLFSRRVLDEVCSAVGRNSTNDRSPSSDYFTGQCQALFSGDELKRHASKIERHFRNLELPDERLVASSLKSEAYMAAARRPPETRGRIQFDDDTRRVCFDGRFFQVEDVTPYELLKVIAFARPYRVTSREFEVRTRLAGKRISRELGKLPATLQKLIDTTSAGHCLVLPPKK
jgi:hypothetical protein